MTHGSEQTTVGPEQDIVDLVVAGNNSLKLYPYPLGLLGVAPGREEEEARPAEDYSVEALEDLRVGRVEERQGHGLRGRSEDKSDSARVCVAITD